MPRNPIQNLQDTLSEVRQQLELVQEELRDQEERRYIKRLRSLDTKEGVRRVHELAEADGLSLSAAANTLIGTPPRPIAPRTSRQDLEAYAAAADAEVSHVAAADGELIEHISKTREEVE